MRLGGTQTITTHGGHIFPLSMFRGLCYLNQRRPTDYEMETLPQVIMTNDAVLDPSIYDDEITLAERLIHLPHIPHGENEEMYDIEGNLEFDASTTILQNNNNIVETIPFDRFDNNSTKIVSIVDWDLDNTPEPVSITFVPTVWSVFIYNEYAGGNIQEHTIHSRVQLQDYKK